MNKNEIKNKIINFDIMLILNIIKNNIFMILFFTLLGLISGYFIINQETTNRKFELIIKIPEHDYRAKQNLIFVNDKLSRIQNLSREKLFMHSLIQSKAIPNIPSINMQKQILTITTSDLNNIILEYSKNTLLYEDTKKMYNDQVRLDFSNKEDQDKHLITSNPTYLSLTAETNLPEIKIRIFFAENYTEYLADNYSRIYLLNIIKYIDQALEEKLDKIFDRYNFEKEQIESYIVFTLRDNVALQSSKQDRVDKMVLGVLTQNIMTGVEIDQKTREKIINQASGIIDSLDKQSNRDISEIMEKINILFYDRLEYFDSFDIDFEYFYQSNDINQSYKNRYSRKIILQDHNNIFFYGILGMIIGIIISFGRYNYSKA